MDFDPEGNRRSRYKGSERERRDKIREEAIDAKTDEEGVSELDTNDTHALLNEIDVLRQRLKGVDSPNARIEEWYKVVVEKSKGGFRHETIEKETLETVFRIFEEEVKMG